MSPVINVCTQQVTEEPCILYCKGYKPTGREIVCFRTVGLDFNSDYNWVAVDTKAALYEGVLALILLWPFSVQLAWTLFRVIFYFIISNSISPTSRHTTP